MNVRRVKLVAAIPIAVLACSQQSFATSLQSEQGRNKTVNVADLNLSRPADVETLYQRIQAAARAVCSDELRAFRAKTRSFEPSGWRTSCIAGATEGAVQSVNDSRLTAVHHRVSETVARR